MLSITTAQTANNSGASIIVAKGRGKQKTTRYDHAKSVMANHGAAAGALANIILSDLEKAKMVHPSGGQRFGMESLSEAGGRYRFNLNL